MGPIKLTACALVLIGILAGCDSKANPGARHVPATSGPAGAATRPRPQPVVLGTEELGPFIAACIEHQARICKEFGVGEIRFKADPAANDPESAYSDSARCQAFAMPDGTTFFAFDSLAVTGAVVFDSASREILGILPWSRTVTQKHDGGFVFDRTFYRLRQDPSGKWAVTALVFAIFDDRHNPQYETWEFHHGPQSGGSSRRYVMESVRDSPTGDPGAKAGGQSARGRSVR